MWSKRVEVLKTGKLLIDGRSAKCRIPEARRAFITCPASGIFQYFPLKNKEKLAIINMLKCVFVYA